jgi:aryl-alcohol dehydrogenase-like predicted oxidoreductase
MEQRHFGRTGLHVSALGFGCGAVGGLMTKGEPADQQRAVAHAIDSGITYFDTAAMYGNGTSEQNLGRVLRELNAWGKVAVGTKLRLRGEDLSDIPGAVRRSVEASLARLNHERVDLIQLHNRLSVQTSPDGDALGPDAFDAAIAAMRELELEGKVGHVGITGLGETASVRHAIDTNKVDSVQSYYNAINPSAGFGGAHGGSQDFGGLIDLAEGRAMGVIAIRVMAAGAMAGDRPRPPLAGGAGPAIGGSEFTGDVRRAASLEELAKELGLESALELSLRFVLANNGVSTALVGYSDFGQLEDALRWAERGPLSPDAVDRVVANARR